MDLQESNAVTLRGNVAQCPLQSFWPPLNVLNVAWLLPPSIQCSRQRFEDLDSYLSLLSNTLGPRDAGCLNLEHSVPLGAKWKMLKNQITVSIHVSRAAINFWFSYFFPFRSVVASFAIDKKWKPFQSNNFHWAVWHLFLTAIQ